MFMLHVFVHARFPCRHSAWSRTHEHGHRPKHEHDMDINIRLKMTNRYGACTGALIVKLIIFSFLINCTRSGLASPVLNVDPDNRYHFCHGYWRPRYDIVPEIDRLGLIIRKFFKYS